jgi:hypothetical protein
LLRGGQAAVAASTGGGASGGAVRLEDRLRPFTRRGGLASSRVGGDAGRAAASDRTQQSANRRRTGSPW